MYHTFECIPGIIRWIPSHVTLAFSVVKLHVCWEQITWNQISHGRGKYPSFHPVRRRHLSFMGFFLLLFCHKVMAASDVRVAVGAVLTLALGVLECSPSLNSPRSNLQTTAEFWQILPRCLLPLGDTFFIYFPLLRSGIHSMEHWPLKLLSVPFSFHVWKTKWIYRVYCQPLPFFWPYECGKVFYFLFLYLRTLRLFLMPCSLFSSWGRVKILRLLWRRWRTYCCMRLFSQQKNNRNFNFSKHSKTHVYFEMTEL